MAYITTAERVGIQKGRIEGLLDGIALALEIKFGPAGIDLMPPCCACMVVPGHVVVPDSAISAE